MTTIRLILFRSSNEGSWFLSRKARELINYNSVSPAELCFVYDCVENIRLIASSLMRHNIPLRKLENNTNIQKEKCILINLNSFCNTDISRYGYVFFLLSRRLEGKRFPLVRYLKDQHIWELYLGLCRHAYQEGDDLSFLLNTEMITDAEWRDPGVVYFQKGKDHWEAYWQGTPRWMVPEMLVRISDALGKHQEGFLERGFSGMAALTMKEIASSVGSTESSVSRIISGVEAETPWGRLPLKCLFSQKVISAHGFTSQTSVIEKVAKIIDTEDKRKPLSDENIAKILRREGINIACRTINKYRQKLKIASSSERKKDEDYS